MEPRASETRPRARLSSMSMKNWLKPPWMNSQLTFFSVADWEMRSPPSVTSSPRAADHQLSGDWRAQSPGHVPAAVTWLSPDHSTRDSLPGTDPALRRQSRGSHIAPRATHSPVRPQAGASTSSPALRSPAIDLTRCGSDSGRQDGATGSAEWLVRNVDQRWRARQAAPLRRRIDWYEALVFGEARFDLNILICCSSTHSSGGLWFQTNLYWLSQKLLPFHLGRS